MKIPLLARMDIGTNPTRNVSSVAKPPQTKALVGCCVLMAGANEDEEAGIGGVL